MLGEAEKPSGNSETLADSCEVDRSLCAVEHSAYTLYLSSVLSPPQKVDGTYSVHRS